MNTTASLLTDLRKTRVTSYLYASYLHTSTAHLICCDVDHIVSQEAIEGFLKNRYRLTVKLRNGSTVALTIRKVTPDILVVEKREKLFPNDRKLS